MRLADSGEVFGHFLIPITEEESTRKALAEALAKSTKGHGAIPPKLTSIAGECDLLLHLNLNDFRVVSDLQADVVDSYSLATSWIYAIPYETPTVEDLPASLIEFFIYLRVHRHYYACYGAAGERTLVDAVARKLNSRPGKQLTGRVLYSLGWPDLIVHGFLSGDIQHLRRLIVSLQSLSFLSLPQADGSRPKSKTPVFIKTITLLGVPTKLTGDHQGHLLSGDLTLPAPLLLGRNRPGQTSQAIRSLRRAFEKSGATTVASWALDGTWDFLVTSPSHEKISLARFHEEIRRKHRGFSKAGVERTQTHLLTSGEADLERIKSRAVTLQPTPVRLLLPNHCGCAQESFQELRNQLEHAELDQQLPKGLMRTISHVLEMFRHTLRDDSNCCDSVGALRAHAHGLGVLLRFLRNERKLLALTPTTSIDQQALHATEISFINSHLVEWCKRAGRVVREKTAASSARLFLQVDSIVAQRGAIPKILMIAERIMQDFYHMLPPGLHGRETPAPTRHFAAILEPLGNVTSQPLMGLVSIPIRYAFALHLVVPQLWHEVGQYVFWAEYGPAHRARVNLQIAREDGNPEMTHSRQKEESFDVDFQLRADMFADVLVFCFGFGGNLRNFFLYLASLTANVAKHDNLHQQSWERQALALVHRLFFISQFLRLHRVLQRNLTATRKQVDIECYRLHNSLVSGREEEAQKLVRNIIAYLVDTSKDDGWPKEFSIPATLVTGVVRNLKTKVYARTLRDMAFLAYEFRGLSLENKPEGLDREIWNSLESGELVEFPSRESLHAAYRDFYLEELSAQLAGGAALPRKEQFRKMATLGRSALLHIYQSEVAAQ